MPNTVIIDTHWGDSGKGRIVDNLSNYYDYVVRFQGGNNAGHTIVVDDEVFKLHQIPSGIIRDKKCVLGNGMVINPEALLKEIKSLEVKGLKLKGNLFISHKAHIITPNHIQRDIEKEKILNIGTTKKGIGPCYSDKISRQGLRFIDVLNDSSLYFDPNIIKELEPYIEDTFSVLQTALDNEKEILFEGAQGTFLDVDHGSYPYVTSSNTVSAQACIGTGIAPKYIEEVIGVCKAYTTRVGEGPFVSELKDQYGELIRVKGLEYGTTTGRPRRCGWLDLVMLNEAKQLNGIDSIALTKLDVLTGLEEIKICESYSYSDEEKNKKFKDINKAIPNYVSFPGWSEDISYCLTYKELPKEVKNIIKYIEDKIKVNIEMISVSPERNKLIVKN